MAKRTTAAPGTGNRSLILESAESLGRMIGALQRQLGVRPGNSGPTPKKVNSGTRKKKRPAEQPKTKSPTKKKRRG
jgi:hypothetical protein